MTIAQWLKQATDELADDLLPSPRLDAEIILAHTLRHPRTYLHAHSDDELSLRDVDIANARIELRKDRVPVAYIIGHKEFYGRRFKVSPSVLIPRPESEQLVTMLRALLLTSRALPGLAPVRLIDIGTGSGCLGVTIKLEIPELSVALVDTSRHALQIAEKNARALGAEVETFVSDLLQGYPYSPDIIVANLPYVDRSWDQSPELLNEPAEALYADDGGLSLIKRCIEQVAARSKPSALLLLEADPRQLDAISLYANQHGFNEEVRDQFAIGLRLS
ncbi:peptide chain release factor N(5)-glutamine methyltransferase [Candidatus Saccharibacteria bacterium]|nr:peptide chain release factor N(5)-glutamine methyltransferase [Candidatus Saccharibacteria bacterium]